MYKIEIVKNGPVDRIILKEVHEDLPRVQVIDCQYRFNSKIVASKNIEKDLSPRRQDMEVYSFAREFCKNTPVLPAVMRDMFNDR